MTTLKLEAMRVCIPRLAGHGVLMTHTVPSQFTLPLSQRAGNHRQSLKETKSSIPKGMAQRRPGVRVLDWRQNATERPVEREQSNVTKQTKQSKQMCKSSTISTTYQPMIFSLRYSKASRGRGLVKMSANCSLVSILSTVNCKER